MENLVKISKNFSKIERTAVALQVLGIPKKEIYIPRKDRTKTNMGFFNWHSPEYYWCLLEKAKSQYRVQIKKEHPDRGGNPALIPAIVRAWEIVQRHFKKNGYELV